MVHRTHTHTEGGYILKKHHQRVSVYGAMSCDYPLGETVRTMLQEHT